MEEMLSTLPRGLEIAGQGKAWYICGGKGGG